MPTDFGQSFYKIIIYNSDKIVQLGLFGQNQTIQEKWTYWDNIGQFGEIVLFGQLNKMTFRDKSDNYFPICTILS